MGTLIRKEIPSWSIAVKEQIFEEGAERIVRKGKQVTIVLLDIFVSLKYMLTTARTVRFLDSNDQVIGPITVAKESRFVGKC